MSVKILKREYSNPFRPEKVDWLLGNVGDWIKAKFLVEAGVDFLATQAEPLSINTEEKTLQLMNGKKWSDYGFDIGNEVTMSYVVQTTDSETQESTTDTKEFTFNIVQLFGDTIVYDNNIDFIEIGYETIPTERADAKIYSVKLYVDKEIEGVRVKYQHISNEDVQSHSLNSFIDGTTTEATYVGLDSLGVGIGQMNLLSKQSGMSIKEVTVKKGNTGAGSGTANFDAINLNQNVNSQFNANQYMKVCRPIAVTKTEGDTPPYAISVADYFPVATGNNFTYLNADPDTLFLNNSNFTDARFLSIDLSFKIITNNNGSNPNRLRLVLLKFDGGNSYNFVERIALDEWAVTNEIRGQLLSYTNIITLPVNIGDSYGLGFEFSTGGVGSFVTRSITYQVVSGGFQVLSGLSDNSYKKQYEVELSFMLSSFFEGLETFETLQAPSIIFDANSLTDNIEFSFLPKWNNPNIAIKNDMTETERLGNTGWFFENFNGLPNNFSLKSLQYFDIGGAPINSLSYGQDAKVKATISGVNNLGANSKFMYGFMWIPSDEAQYKNKATPFYKNTKVNSPANEAFILGQTYPFVYEGYSEEGTQLMNVTNVAFTQSGTDLVFDATFSPTAAFRDFFLARDQDRNYILWVSVADSTLETNFSDRVSLLIDFNEMSFFIPVNGELEGVNTDFLEHPQEYDEAGAEVYDGFVEDDVLARSFFQLETGQRLERVIMGYEVENLTTSETFELESYSANLNNFITDSQGVQQIDFNNERGFKLEPGNNKNWVKVVRNQDSDEPGKSGYAIYYAAKMRWEDWIQKFNVPVEFYNNNLPYNGSGNNWLDYLRAGNNHKINYFVIFDVVEDGVLVRYKNDFFLNFEGYDENSDITTEHKYFDNDTNTLLNVGVDAETGRPLGAILSNKYTRIEITYTKVTGNWDLTNVYAVTSMEVDKGVGFLEYRQLSSIWGSEADNILIPLEGQTKLKVELIAPNKIKTSCLVDYSRLTPASRYKITGRIGCYANNNGVPIDNRKYDANNYENKYE